MEKSVTVVSALYYIGRDRWKHSAFPPGVDRYKSWIHNLLSLDIQLCFSTDDYYYDYIVDIRKQYDPEFKKTIIKKIPLKELHFYKKYYVQEACLMFSPEFKEKIFFPDSADMNYPLYHIINFSKIDFVKQVADENPYNSTHFVWSDAGGMRESRDNYENNTWPTISDEYFNDKIIHFSHKEQYNIYPNKDEYFRSQDRNIQGTAWIVPKEKVNTFFNLIDNQVDTIIKEKIVGSDEKVYDFLHNNNQDLYQLVKCGWFEYYNVLNTKSKLKTSPIIPIMENKTIKLVAITWSDSDANESFQQSNIYKSFKYFNPNKEVVNIHFNKNNYKELEDIYSTKFTNQSEFVLYRIYLALDRINEIEADYIILADVGDTLCLSKVDHLIDTFDLDNHIIYGMEKNDWPKLPIRQSWEGYIDYDEYDTKNIYFLNASSVIAKKEKYVELLQTVINDILSLELKDVSDQGVFTYHYNKKIEPSIKLDTASIFVVNTYDRSPDEYYMHNNKLYSKHNGITPCFIHDNGWQWGSPQYRRIFELDKLYS